MLLICPDFTNFCDNDTTFAILLLTTICETTHKPCRGLAPPETGRRISAKQKLRRSPTPKFYRRKIASLFADFTLQKDTVKAVQSFCSDTALILLFSLYFFFNHSAPLSRLAPIEALPISCERSRTRNLLRQGLCPLTPQALWRRA